MSHQERSSVRAAYIHKAEHLGERRLMLQWWADYLDANNGGLLIRMSLVRVQSEEPNLRSLLSSRLFAFLRR